MAVPPGAGNAPHRRRRCRAQALWNVRKADKWNGWPCDGSSALGGLREGCAPRDGLAHGYHEHGAEPQGMRRDLRRLPSAAVGADNA